MSTALIAVIGAPGAGKSTAARFLAACLPGYAVVESSAALLREYERRNALPVRHLDTYPAKAALRPQLARLADELRANAPQWFSEQALRHTGPLIVVGSRCTADLDRLAARGAVFVEVTASARTRWSRLGTKAFLTARTDSFEREREQFTGPRISVHNNGSRAALAAELIQIGHWLPTARGAALHEAADLMDRLLADHGGCPWNREQDLRTVRQYLIEETVELLETIDADDVDGHRDELGDLLFQVLFQAALRDREGAFDLTSVCRGLIDKMVRRHPHVFSCLEVHGTAEVLHNWSAIKHVERGGSPSPGPPLALPALLRAQRFAEREHDRPPDDAETELRALRAALRSGDTVSGAVLLGSLLMSLVRIAAAAGICAEDALRDRLHSPLSVLPGGAC